MKRQIAAVALLVIPVLVAHSQSSQTDSDLLPDLELPSLGGVDDDAAWSKFETALVGLRRGSACACNSGCHCGECCFVGDCGDSPCGSDSAEGICGSCSLPESEHDPSDGANPLAGDPVVKPHVESTPDGAGTPTAGTETAASSPTVRGFGGAPGVGGGGISAFNGGWGLLYSGANGVGGGGGGRRAAAFAAFGARRFRDRPNLSASD